MKRLLVFLVILIAVSSVSAEVALLQVQSQGGGKDAANTLFNWVEKRSRSKIISVTPVVRRAEGVTGFIICYEPQAESYKYGYVLFSFDGGDFENHALATLSNWEKQNPNKRLVCITSHMSRAEGTSGIIILYTVK